VIGTRGGMALLKRIAASFLATGALVLVLTAAAIVAAVNGFGLTVAGAISLYFVVWWTLLFAVLPFSARGQPEAGDVLAGTDPGAPARPALNETAIWTTILSGLVFVATAAALPLAGL
jgi:predicted secreted protein